MRFAAPFRLIEISVISAQDLAPVSRSVKTYAIAWVHPDRKMTTRVDQIGGCNPNWNEKFVFRVDGDFLESDASDITVEIYSVAWLKKDTRVGIVSVSISDILNSSVQNDRSSSDTRFVALQVRRPSGRPQGILNLSVTLVDNTLRSMPLRTEPAPYPASKPDPKPEMELRRTSSDATGLTTNPHQKASSVINHGSTVGAPKTKDGSVVLAPETKGGSMVSEIGPSASVVAAAISKGIYPIHLAPANRRRQNDGGSLIIGNWRGRDAGVEGLKAKIERWRAEFPPVHDHQKELETQKKTRQARSRRRTVAAGNGVFSCFGNAYGIEFSITCGGNRSKKRVG